MSDREIYGRRVYVDSLRNGKGPRAEYTYVSVRDATDDGLLMCADIATVMEAWKERGWYFVDKPNRCRAARIGSGI